MTTSKDMIIIGGVVKTLCEHNSWSSETHVQKTLYIAKHVRNVPLTAEFLLYKHGPYSFELNKSISHMLARNILRSTQNAGFGPSLDLNRPMWEALDSAAGGYFAQHRDKIEFVCQYLANRNVSELERISTAIFVDINFPQLNSNSKVRKLTELKPHIS